MKRRITRDRSYKASSAVIRALFAFGFSCCVLASSLLSGCAASAETTISVAGSTTVLPIAEIAAEKYSEYSDTRVLVSGLGSSAGIEAVLNGTADIASSSRDLTAQERSEGSLYTTVIARDGIAVIVSPDNKVTNLTLEQLRDIYAGDIVNWSEVGGADLPILVVNRDAASGTREAFKTIVMQNTSFDNRSTVLPGTGQVRDVVSRTPGAIGYISLGFVDSSFSSNKVKALSIDDIIPSEQSVRAQTYPIARDLYFFTKGLPQGVVADFINFVISPEMSDTIMDAGYLPVDAAEALSSQGSLVLESTYNSASQSVYSYLSEQGKRYETLKLPIASDKVCA